MEKRFKVSGMGCAACAANIERRVGKLPGVSQLSVNFLSGEMRLSFDPAQTSEAAILQAVASGGYTAEAVAEEAAPELLLPDEAAGKKRQLVFSVLFFLPLFSVAMRLPLPVKLPDTANGILQLLLTLPVLYINRGYFLRGFAMLFRGTPDMDSLIAAGSGAGIVYSVTALILGVPELYFEAAAMILVLVTFGKFLEARCKRRTGDAIAGLLKLAPATALVERNGGEIELPVSGLKPGDIVLVKPGAAIPADGVVLEGDSAVDQSALTGESVPLEKHPGDRVSAATVNCSGFLKFRAERVGNDTTLAQIIRLVEAAGSSKAPIARVADRISGIFVPAVIAIAVAATVCWLLAGAAFFFAISAGIAVLVVSCPCALGLATPVAVMAGTGRGARAGILFKSAEALETAGSVDTVALDKTGTITSGEPHITDILPAAGVSETELLTTAASLEQRSEHPFAKAILQAAAEKNLVLHPVNGFEAVPGRGIRALLGTKRYFAGNSALIAGKHPVPADAEVLASAGKTPLLFADESRILGIIALADTLKPTAKTAVEAFHALGVETVMLTGDNRHAAEAIRKELGIDRIAPELLPQEKESVIRTLQETGHKVAMVGDGINDAPALARADVGIAIGAGTDIAIDTADIVLMKSDPADAAEAIRLSRAVLRTIRQNLFWAFFYNALGIPLAAGVFYTALGWKLNPVFAAFAMSMSSVCVVGNALRLRFRR